MHKNNHDKCIKILTCKTTKPWGSLSFNEDSPHIPLNCWASNHTENISCENWILGLWGLSDFPSEFLLWFLDKFFMSQFFSFSDLNSLKLSLFLGVFCSFCWGPAVWREGHRIFLRGPEDVPRFSDPEVQLPFKVSRALLAFRLSLKPPLPVRMFCRTGACWERGRVSTRPLRQWLWASL